jgi:hypothetical protein
LAGGRPFASFGTTYLYFEYTRQCYNDRSITITSRFTASHGAQDFQTDTVSCTDD